MKSDYDQAGIPYDPPGVRVDRFVEGIHVIKGLMAEGPFDFAGTHYTIRGHDGLPKPIQRPHPPIVIGGGGRRVLSIAAQEADIVSVNPNLREGLGGAETAPNMIPEMTSRKVQWVREAAGDRFADLELNVLIGFFMITDNPRPIAEAMAPAFGGISPTTPCTFPGVSSAASTSWWKSCNDAARNGASPTSASRVMSRPSRQLSAAWPEPKGAPS